MSQRNSIEAAIQAYVEAGTVAGAATLVWRDGRVVHTAIVGYRDLVTNAPVERSTIFRIASMTKPLTAVHRERRVRRRRHLLDDDDFLLDDFLAGDRQAQPHADTGKQEGDEPAIDRDGMFDDQEAVFREPEGRDQDCRPRSRK